MHGFFKALVKSWKVLLGVTLGVGLVALFSASRILEEDLKTLIIDELEGELQKVCKRCNIAHDGISISLLTGYGEIAQPRITEDEENVALSFHRITANFQIGSLWNRIIDLDLTLESGHANGLGPQSVTFKFIDQLSTPSDAPPSFVRVRLQNLAVVNTTFIEPVARGTIGGDGLNLSLSRTGDTEMLLKPELKSLTWLAHHWKIQEPVSLGKLKAILSLNDGNISFRHLSLKREQAELRMTGTSTQNQLRGNFSFSGDTPSIDHEEVALGTFKGGGTVAGTLGSPILEGHVALAPHNDDIFTVFLNHSPLLEFNEGSAKIGYNHALDLVSVTNLAGSGKGVVLHEPSEVTIKDIDLNALLTLDIDALEFAGLKGEGIEATVSENGSSLEPFLPHVSLKMQKLRIGTLSFDSIAVEIESSEERIDIVGYNTNKSISAKIQLDPETGLVDSGTVDFERYAFPILVGNMELQNRISGTLVSTGGSDLPFKGEITSVSSHQNLGELELSHKLNGSLEKVHIDSSNGDILTSSLDYQRDVSRESSLDLALSSLPLSVRLPDCFDTGLALSYKFSSAAPWSGRGALDVNRLMWGCPPRVLQLEALERITISNGALQLSQVALKGFQEDLRANGNISFTEGLDISVQGQASLPRLGFLVPSIDELSGSLSLQASIRGPFLRPTVTGQALLTEGAIGKDDAGILLEKLSGHIKVDSDSIVLSDLEGILNQGTISLSGVVYPFDIAKSRLFSSFDGIFLEPVTDTYFVAKGDVNLTADQDLTPTLEGDITILEGEFRRSFDLRTLANSLTQSFQNDSTWSKPVSLPSINLSLNLNAERDLFIITNLMEAELDADLYVGGTLAQPQVQGALNTLGGWFGLNNRQFDISNGTVKFGSADNLPIIDIVGETIIRTRIGETTNVVLEAEGPIDNPQIQLAADREIPQNELLTLLATNQRGVFESSRRSRGVTPLSARDIFRFGLPYFLGKFFDKLTSIDYFSIEPTYNLLTSTIQPSIVAEKQIIENSFIRGQALFGGNFTESSLKLVNEFESQYQLALGIESASTNQNNALAVDLSYTVLEAFSTDLSFDFRGNRSISNAEIREAARINTFSSVTPKRTNTIADRIRELYRSQGFYSTDVSVDCLELKKVCSRLGVRIKEGPQQKIVTQNIQTDLPPSLESALSEEINKIGSTASSNLVETTTREIQSFLHTLGYYRVEVNVEISPSEHGASLDVKVQSGKPVQVTFWGSNYFNEQELLKEMQLLERTRPLGSNTLRRGIENIERLYREHGFLYTSISYQEDEQPDKLYFHIYIHEEPRIRVDQVILHGNDTISLDTLLEKMGSDASNFLEPKYAVAEDVEYHAYELKRIYSELGFPNVEIRTSLESGSDPRLINIAYYVTEGEPIYAEALAIKGLPPTLTAPTPPGAPYSVPVANIYIRQVYDLLRQNGYRFASIWSEFDETLERVVIQVDPGPLTIIGKINVTGNNFVDVREIISRLTFLEGDPWNERLLSSSKRNLLKTGLFSRVVMKAGDGEIDDSLEDMIIEIVERPLRSLVVGTGANSLFGLHLFGEYTDKQLFADGRKLTVRSDLYVEGLVDNSEPDISQGIASLIHTNPNLFSSSTSLVSDLRFQKLTTLTQEFDVERIATTNLLNFSLSDRVTASLGHTLSFDNIVSVPEDVKLSKLDSGNVRLGFLSGSTTLDLRDSPLNPRKGITSSINYKVSIPGLLSQASFYTLGARATALAPINTHLTLAAASRWGWADTFGDTSAVPITQRYYLGGRASVRGFRENSLGPLGEQQNVIGGELLQNNSLELQYRLYPELQIHTFFDSGSMALQSAKSDFWSFRTSAGFGSRYLSPIGPIGFDVGFPLDEREGEPSVRFHFNIGSQF